MRRRGTRRPTVRHAVSSLASSEPNRASAWRFPFGTNEYDSAWAFSRGKLRFVLGDAIERGRDGLPPGANESAYYWIEIRPRWNSWVEFYGDAPSDLEDPCFWAKAGETYRVTLLIGKTYEVESSQPIDEVMAEFMCAEKLLERKNVPSPGMTFSKGL